MSKVECTAEGIADPLAPDAMCKAVQSGCIHCIASVICAREMEKGTEPLDAVGALLQVVTEIMASGVINNAFEAGDARKGLIEITGEMFDETLAGLRDDKARREH